MNKVARDGLRILGGEQASAWVRNGVAGRPVDVSAVALRGSGVITLLIGDVGVVGIVEVEVGTQTIDPAVVCTRNDLVVVLVVIPLGRNLVSRGPDAGKGLGAGIEPLAGNHAVCNGGAVRKDSSSQIVATVPVDGGSICLDAEGCVGSGIGEVAALHVRRWNVGRQPVAIAEVLQDALVAAPDHDFLGCEGDGSTTVAARIVIGGGSLLGPIVIALPVVGCEDVVTGIEVAFAMILRAARFAEVVDEHRAVFRVSAEVGSLNADFLGHIRIDCGDRVAIATGIVDVNAVHRDGCAAAVGGAVGVEAVADRGAGCADVLEVVGRAIVGAVGRRGDAGQNLEQL